LFPFFRLRRKPAALDSAHEFASGFANRKHVRILSDSPREKQVTGTLADPLLLR
jgi:hypothetical protein